MHSWIFRNLRRLEAIYAGAGRSSQERARPSAAQPAQPAPPLGGNAGESSGPALCIFELIPRSRRRTAP